MKNKILYISLLLLSLTLITGCGKTKKQNKVTPTPSPETEKPENKIKNETPEDQGDYLVQNVKLEIHGAESVITGTVTSKVESQRSIVVLLKMMDTETGRLLGIANVDVNELNPGETREFSLSMVGDYSDVDYFDVTILG